ncbi:MAG: aspartate/glutamate racemase family protein [Alphaproteobacteria bacterium]|jgi:allantoin racemase|nr:Asp/Glu racemase [Rhodospirillaceae bacterium]MDG2479947.1 aspartate/glutamate racemase family protein [Alphaproteobacteria bacterium]MBT6206290.1 Asp/Glu racemase [Rhodospirillaceae bacterium]MBT6511224.1 Asp/Glu racemase [Rhodospirillaceae bacterium]MBT7614302.1 Asp/Glu racemase [Rhodospirillaceae bacterium]
MTDRILVINPNSSADVTDRMSAALDGLRFAEGPVIDCMTLKEGPPGVETDRHIADVVAPIVATVEREQNRTNAFIIACFSDPGLHAAKEASWVPVYGIAQCGYAAAVAMGERFGVISILSRSLPRHRRQLGGLGLLDKLAGDLAIDMGVTELSQRDKVLNRMTAVGGKLKNEHGADAIVMGCAGMAQYRSLLEQRLGIPVIDPTQAATAVALNAVQAAKH